MLPDVIELLGEVLSLQGRAQALSAETPLLGAMPEMDSMAVAEIMAEMQTRWGIVAADIEELDARTFETVGSLVAFIERHRVPATDSF